MGYGSSEITANAPGNDAGGARYVAPTPLKPAATPTEKLAVGASSVGFTGWPASGRVTVIFTVETADVYFSPFGDATANSRILRVGDTVILEDLNPALMVPEFLRASSIDGEVRAEFYVRS